MCTDNIINSEKYKVRSDLRKKMFLKMTEPGFDETKDLLIKTDHTGEHSQDIHSSAWGGFHKEFRLVLS